MSLQVLGAVDELVRRMRSEGGYVAGAPYVLYEPNRTLLETFIDFTVVLRGGVTRTYWVTTAGFIGAERGNREHLAFLNLNECDTYELTHMSAELHKLIAQPASA